MPADWIWPNDLRPLTAEWQLLKAGGAVRTTSGKLHTADYGFGLWRCTARWQGDIYRGNLYISRVEGTLAKIVGQVTTVGLPRWERAAGPVGGISGNKPTAVSSGILGRQLQVQGVAGTNPVLRAGDVFTFMDYMYMITQDIHESGGVATLQFSPDLKLPSVAGEDIRFDGIDANQEDRVVRCMMVLESFTTPGATYRAPSIGQITATFLEVTP